MEEQEYLSIYLEELKDLPELTQEQEAELTSALLSGEPGAKEKLTEGNLRTVLEEARGYLGRGVPLGDLIQEGNLGLMEAFATFEAGMDFRRHIRAAVRAAMEDALEEESGEAAAKDRMVETMNKMDEITTKLAEELGREATLAEVAEQMGLPEDEVHMLMREALNAIQ